MSANTTEALSASVNLPATPVKSYRKGSTGQPFSIVLDSTVKSNSSSRQNLKKAADLGSSRDSLPVDNEQSQVTDKSGQTGEVPQEKDVIKQEPNDKIDEGFSEEETSMEETVPSQNLQYMLDVIAQQLGISKEQLITDYNKLQKEITHIITGNLGITEEELMSVLEASGLTIMDVTEPSNLMNLVVSLNEKLDVSDILTDENLYAQLKGITEELDAACADLSPEELTQIKQSIKNLQDNHFDVQVYDSVSEPMDNPGLRTEETTGYKKELLDQTQPEVQSATKIEEKGNPDLKESGHNKDNPGHDGFRGFVNQLVDTVKQSGSSQTSKVFMNQPEAGNILRQLVDQIKIQVKADTSSMEMQLYPESYGKLNLHVSVKDGIVTAQIATESEAVKRALETQVIQLKETMNEQGLKIESVEVTVQSHEFERNLQQDQSQQSFKEKEHKVHKNINLNEEELLDENTDASEEEILIRKIMIQNGSSINYSA